MMLLNWYTLHPPSTIKNKPMIYVTLLVTSLTNNIDYTNQKVHFRILKQCHRHRISLYTIICKCLHFLISLIIKRHLN